MSKKILLVDFIQHLKDELNQNQSDDKPLIISSAQVEVALLATLDDDGKLSFEIAAPDESKPESLHRLKLTLTNSTPEQELTSKDLDFSAQNLSLVEQEDPEDDFEGFKKRVHESVIRHGGVPPNKKKNIFD